MDVCDKLVNQVLKSLLDSTQDMTYADDSHHRFLQRQKLLEVTTQIQENQSSLNLCNINIKTMSVVLIQSPDNQEINDTESNNDSNDNNSY
jgi:hypothetical protein